MILIMIEKGAEEMSDYAGSPYSVDIMTDTGLRMIIRGVLGPGSVTALKKSLVDFESLNFDQNITNQQKGEITNISIVKED